MTIRIETVTDEAGFIALEDEWGELLSRAQNESVFLSHGWFRSFWHQTMAQGRPSILIARDGDAAVGVAPMVMHRHQWRGLPARAISLIRNQDSPFSDFILDRECPEEVLAAFLHAFRGRADWDVIRLPAVPRWSNTYSLLPSVLGDQSFIRNDGDTSPSVDVSGSWDDFWSAQSQRFKKTVRNNANRIKKLGDVEVREMDAKSSLSDCLECFLAVASKSWKASLPTSAVCNADIRRFFERLTGILQPADRSALWVLFVDGEPFATEYHVRDGDTVYALRSDFVDSQGAASPGAFLHSHIVREYFNRGLSTYDMGPGEREYKSRWATEVRCGDTFWIFNDRPYSAALRVVEERAVPAFRRARSWWAGEPDAGAVTFGAQAKS